jgi:hypothetical protein
MKSKFSFLLICFFIMSWFAEVCYATNITDVETAGPAVQEDSQSVRRWYRETFNLL